MLRLRLMTLLFTFALLLPLLPAAAQEEDAPLNVVTTTTQVADAVRVIGGEHVEVIGLLGSGVDPHLYVFTEADINAMRGADVVIYNGLHLEGRIDDVLADMEERGIPVLAAGLTVEENGYALPSAADVSTADPHIWFDPRNWQLVTESIVAFLSQIDPENAETYAANGEAYNAQLQSLYDWGVEAMALIPEEQRILVTSHDAFQYFGDAFGWQVVGVQGISTEAEAGVGDVEAVVDFVVENQIPTLFVESSVPAATIEAVQAGAADRDWEVTIGGELFSDAMGALDSYEGMYIGMVRYNIELIVTAFGYSDDLPAWPEELPAREAAE